MQLLNAIDYMMQVVIYANKHVYIHYKHAWTVFNHDEMHMFKKLNYKISFHIVYNLSVLYILHLSNVQYAKDF